MKISNMFGHKKTVFSIEVFPPKKNTPIETIYPVLEKFAEFNPDYISVTCGAGGSITEKSVNTTLEIASFVKSTCKIEAMAHMTCLNSSKEDVVRTLHDLNAHGIDNILALRGDDNPDIPKQNDFNYASELVAFIKNHTMGENFCIAGACYPEGHIEANSVNADVQNLKKKVDAGAKTLVTQLFFDNEFFYSFMEKARLIGITIPVSAGIMPVTNKRQIERMVSMCGASLPPKFVKMIARYESRHDALKDAGIAYATDQIVDLISNGVEGIHLYSMNSPYVARKIYNNIEKLI